MKSWLRRFIMRRFNLVPRCDYAGACTQIRLLESELCRLRMDYRWACHRIDELNTEIRDNKKGAWQMGLRRAHNDLNRNITKEAI